uniref:Lipocalin n=1 Tax=Rhipicephalus appendiculatus TaxID=34631 RepID=A0A131YFJ2_RHIAP
MVRMIFLILFVACPSAFGQNCIACSQHLVYFMTDTSQPIWTYLRNDTTGIYCDAYEMRRADGDNVIYRQTELQGWKLLTSDIYMWTFQDQNTMYRIERQERPDFDYIKYTMRKVYGHPILWCTIVSMQIDWVKISSHKTGPENTTLYHLELLVYDRDIHKDLQPCIREYRNRVVFPQYAKHIIDTLYDKNKCQGARDLLKEL